MRTPTHLKRRNASEDNGFKKVNPRNNVSFPMKIQMVHDHFIKGKQIVF